ncbi:MAG: DUF1007 family protein [Alphaproteobacteria bacterium]|nr:DUF1007 family protein [Alphaproteobacteria bacterium]
MPTGASGFPAVAHPHDWIDLRSAVVLDTAGPITAVVDRDRMVIRLLRQG